MIANFFFIDNKEKSMETQLQNRLITGFSLLFGLILFSYVNIPIEFIMLLLIGLNIYDFDYLHQRTTNSIIYMYLIPFSFLANLCIWIHLLQNNKKILFHISLVVSVSDAFQYLIGKHFGKYKVNIGPSPHKTLEGYTTAIITAFIFKFYFNINVAIFAVIWGIIGDLFVSKAKRSAHIKDISNLFNGHGGFLDRVDGVYMSIIAYTLLL